jgi:hypothetical protein
MANIVQNRVDVRGPEEDLKAFSSAVSGKTDSLYYQPKVGEILGLGWDAKWLEHKNNEIVFYVASKWGPPSDLYVASMDFPKLTFDLSYYGQGPVYGREFMSGGEIQMTTSPENEKEFAELVDLVSYQYDHETQEQFNNRKLEEVQELMGKDLLTEPPAPSEAPVISLWLAGIGALGAYTYFKRK